MATKPAATPKAKPKAKAATKPVAKPASKLAAKPATASAAKATTKPAVKAVAKSATNPGGKSAKVADKKVGKAVGPTQRDSFLAPFDDMERWFDDALKRRFLGFPRFSLPELRMPWAGEISPHVDIYEEAKEVVVKAELPGMKRADIDVSIADDIITISGEKKAEEKVEKKDYFHVERSYGSFTRRLRLPAAAVGERATATFKEGVLEIRIPKTAQAQAKQKKIQVE